MRKVKFITDQKPVIKKPLLGILSKTHVVNGLIFTQKGILIL